MEEKNIIKKLAGTARKITKNTSLQAIAAKTKLPVFFRRQNETAYRGVFFRR